VPHIDKQDAGAALTAMTLLLSVPENYNPGIFAYHDFKLFIRPLKPSIVYFTGLHRHGGTAPSPPHGHPIIPWAYRLTIICYPNGPTMAGESRNPLVPFYGFDVVKKEVTGNNRSDVLKMPPEIRFRERYSSPSLLVIRIDPHGRYRPNSERANLARDGPSVQGPLALITTISREVALMVDQVFAVFRSQYPDHNVRVDYNAIFEAISMSKKAVDGESGGGEPVTFHPIRWANTPPADGCTQEFVGRLQEYRNFMDHFAMHTPH
jgi:hypothetical protein